MRLQSAIFTLGDTLFTPDGAAREGLDKALSLFKMEGVWLGAVTALSAEDAQKALEKAGEMLGGDPAAPVLHAYHHLVGLGGGHPVTGLEVFLAGTGFNANVLIT